MYGINCLKCKGRLWCGLKQCPILSKIKLKKELKLKKEIKSKTNGVFIGWHGYPKVYGGILSPYEKIQPLKPNDWVNKNYSIINVMNYLSSIIHSRKKVKINDIKGFNEFVIKSALTKKPLDIDINFKKIPELKITYNIHAQPFGPSAEVENINIDDDPKMSKAVSKVYYDNDLKANNAIIYLHSKKTNIYDISTLLSAGAIGMEKNRKLVPTRWSITATDDIIAKDLIKKIKNYPLLDHFIVFNNSYLGNKITILMLPRMWSYELIEEWNKGAVFTENHQIVTDFEGYNGRKKYASNTTGGYYASRLPVLEWLLNKKLQASVLITRQITKEYYMPLGVWVVREAVRNALKNVKQFNDFSNAKKYVSTLTNIDLRISKLIREKQLTLNFF